MVKWIIENINIFDWAFQNSRQMVIRSFTAKDLKRMYHIPDPQKVYYKAFLEHFTTENEESSDLIRQWRFNSNKHKHEKSGMYTITPLVAPYSYIAAMMCRIFGYADTTRFSVEWVPLIDVTVNYFTMDWGTIFSNNLALQILEYRQKWFVTSRKSHHFLWVPTSWMQYVSPLVS